MSVGLVDVVIVLVVLVSLLDGLRVGGMRVVFGTATLAASIAMAVAFQDPMTSSARELTSFPPLVSRAIALLEILLLVDTLLTIAGRYAVGRLPRPSGTWAAGVDRLAGVTVGAFRGVLAAVVGLAVLLLVPLGGPVHDDVDRSPLGSRVVVAAMRYERESPLGARRLFDVQLDGTVEVPFDVPIGLSAPRDEETEQMLASLANAERRRSGIRELVVDPRLTEVARRHSEEMVRFRYFGHRSPITGLADDRLADAGIAFSRVHEVLVIGSSALVVHERVAASPLQGARMLDPDATRMGVGVLDAGIYGLVITELYVSGP